MRQFIVTLNLLIALLVTSCAHAPSEIDRMELDAHRRALAVCYEKRPELASERGFNPAFVLTAHSSVEDELVTYRRAFERCWADNVAQLTPPKEEPSLAVEGPGCVLTAYPIQGMPDSAKPILWLVPDVGRHYVPLGVGDTPIHVVFQVESEERRNSFSKKTMSGAPAEIATTTPVLDRVGSCQLLRQTLCLHKRLTYCPSFQ